MEIYVYLQRKQPIRELKVTSEKGEWYEDSPTGIDLCNGLIMACSTLDNQLVICLRRYRDGENKWTDGT